MINFIFFFFITLGLTILQTVVIPDCSWSTYCFDLMIINVLYLSLFSQRYWVPFCLVIIGGIMDSLSGAPFFLHTALYLCLFMIVFFLRRLVFQRSAIFVFIVGIASACIHQGLILFTVFLRQGQMAVTPTDYRLCIGQVIWAAVGIPCGVWLLETIHRNLSLAVKQSRRQMADKYGG